MSTVDLVGIFLIVLGFFIYLGTLKVALRIEDTIKNDSSSREERQGDANPFQQISDWEVKEKIGS